MLAATDEAMMRLWICTLLCCTVCASAGADLALVVNGRTFAPDVVAAQNDRLHIAAGVLAAATGVSTDDRQAQWFGITCATAPSTAGATPATGSAASVELGQIAEAFGWKIVRRPDAVEIWGPGASVLGVRQGQHPDRTRVVIDLSGPAVFQTQPTDERLTILIPPGEGSIATAGELRLFEFDGERAARVTCEVLQDGWTRVVIAPPAAGRWHIFALPDPARIVADLILPERQVGEEAFDAQRSSARPECKSPASQPARSGSNAAEPREKWWRVIHWSTPAGAATVHVLTVDPLHTVELRPALAGPVVNSRASVAAIARANGAIAAVNGGFFSPRFGVPLGMLVINGEWLRAPLPRRPVLAIMRDGRCEIARVQWLGRVHFSGLGSLPLLGLNQNHWETDSVVAYTHRWGAKVPALPKSTRLIVSSRGRVIFRETSGRAVPVPAGGMVLSGVGRRAASLCKVPIGCRVTLRFDIRPRWPNLLHAVGGGPLLIAAGKVVLDPKSEGFRSDVASGRHARTAVGVRPDGQVILVAAEGRPNGRGPGLTLWELAKLMLKLGAATAMNLDGGSSTTLVVHDRVVTACAGGSPRLVNNALVIVPRSLRPNG